MNRFELSRSAEQDLEDVDAQTFDLFVLAQVVRLKDAFRTAFDTLIAMPFSGHERPDLDPPGRTFRYRSVLGRFVIV